MHSKYTCIVSRTHVLSERRRQAANVEAQALANAQLEFQAVVKLLAILEQGQQQYANLAHFPGTDVLSRTLLLSAITDANSSCVMATRMTTLNMVSPRHISPRNAVGPLTEMVPC